MWISALVPATFALASPPRPSDQVPIPRIILPADPRVGPLPAGIEIDPAHAYTLPELIDLAQHLNPETRVAWDEARETLEAEGIAKSAFLPRLSAAVITTYANGSTDSSVFGVGLTQRDSTGAAAAVVSLQWLLFDFGERSASSAAAGERHRIGDIRFTAAHQRLIHEVTLAYYACLAARARAEQTSLSLADAQDIARAAQARYAKGIGTVMEVDQARQASAQARLVQVQADGAAADALLTLLAAIGLSPLQQVMLAELPHRPLSPVLIERVDQVVATALSRRPDVQAAYAATQASIDDVRAATAARRPKLFVAATGSYADTTLGLTAIPAVGDALPALNLGGRHWGATVMGGISVPLYDGGVRRAAEAGARAKADAADATLDRVKIEAARQIAAAHNQLVTSLAAAEAADALLKAAETTFAAAAAAYRAGVGAAPEVLTAERQLIEARAVATDARFAALSAAATLALASGAPG